MSPNVDLVRQQGIRFVSKLPRAVRNELMQGVRIGCIVHLKKEGLMQEAFCHPDCVEDAVKTRTTRALEAAERLLKITA